MSYLCKRFQATRQIGLDVIHVFEADCHTDQALTNACGLTLVFGEPSVRGAGWMGDGGFDVAQVGRDAAQLRVVDERKARVRPCCASALRTAKDTTEPPMPPIWRMARACCGCEGRPGVEHAFHLRLLLQPLRQLQRWRFEY